MSIFNFFMFTQKNNYAFFGRQKSKSGKQKSIFSTRWKSVHTYGGFIRKKCYGHVKTFSYNSQHISCIYFDPLLWAIDSHSSQKHPLVDTDDSDVWWEKSCGSRNLMLFQWPLFNIFYGKNFLSNVLYTWRSKQRFWNRVSKFNFIS